MTDGARRPGPTLGHWRRLAAGAGIVIMVSAGPLAAGATGAATAGVGGTGVTATADGSARAAQGAGPGSGLHLVVADSTTTVPPTTPTTVPETTTTTSTSTTTTTTVPPTTTTSTSTTTTTLAPLIATNTSSKTPWALIIVIVVLVLAIGLVLVLLAARRRRGVESNWHHAVVPALADAQLARASLLSDNAVSADAEVRGAVAVQVERAAVALEHTVPTAPDAEAGQMASTAAGALRGLAFAIEADRLLRHGTAAPTGMQLAEADEARRARNGELATALARLSTRVSAAAG